MAMWIDADALPRHGKRGGLVQWKDIAEAPSIDIVFCENCSDCVEKGVGVDCPSGYGYLYCRRKKSIVNEDDYCSWGEREGE